MAYPRSPAAIARIGRDEFLSERWDYDPGQHVTILGPTGCGKTILAQQLLVRSATPQLPGIMLVMKPRDKEVTRFLRENRWKRHVSWPPPRVPFMRPPAGHCVWPRATFDFDADDENMARTFGNVLRHSYKVGDRIIMADEVVGLAQELKLGRGLNAIWTRGRSLGTGLWAMTQRPAYVPLNAYSQAEHLLIAYEPDADTRKRYGEIGGVDPKLVSAAVESLPEYHFLYLRRTGRHICIIGP